MILTFRAGAGFYRPRLLKTANLDGKLLPSLDKQMRMMSMIPIAIFLVIQSASAQFVGLSEVDKREPGRIFVSWVGDPPPKFVETREEWFGLQRTSIYQCKDPRFSGLTILEDGLQMSAVACPDVFYEYRVRPGSEAFWVDLMRTQYGVFVASWTARPQLAGHGPLLTDLREDDSFVTAKDSIPVFAPGLNIHKSPNGISAGRDERCVELSDSNRAGAELLEHGTIHDLLIGYVNDFFKRRGHSSVAQDHPQRLVFDVDSIKDEVLKTGPDKSSWERIEIDIVFIDPTRTSSFESKCERIYLTVIGSYAAGTPNVPGPGSFNNSMDQKYSREEQSYAGQFLAGLRSYLTSAEDKKEKHD